MVVAATNCNESSLPCLPYALDHPAGKAFRADGPTGLLTAVRRIKTHTHRVASSWRAHGRRAGRQAPNGSTQDEERRGNRGTFGGHKGGVDNWRRLDVEPLCGRKRESLHLRTQKRPGTRLAVPSNLARHVTSCRTHNTARDATRDETRRGGAPRGKCWTLSVQCSASRCAAPTINRRAYASFPPPTQRNAPLASIAIESVRPIIQHAK